LGVFWELPRTFVAPKNARNAETKRQSGAGQGTVIRILREERTYVTVEIKWDKECMREGDREVSQDKLMQSKWNSNKHKQGTWRENLHHMAKTAEDL
jgi:hypothetical protein